VKPDVLPFRAPLADYQAQADRLLDAWKAGEDRDLMSVIVHQHPKFLRTDVPWAPRRMTEDEIRAVPIDAADARLALARWYDFRDWPALAEYVASVADDDSPATKFETAVEAVINGDASGLKAMLAANPDLVRQRSTRINSFDPPMHRSTLLHYIAANGVEGYRQRTPKNAVEIARVLLEAGADANALSHAYGGDCTTMSLLVSSAHPARAGVQAALVDTLADFGAAVEPLGAGTWTSPLITALVFNYTAAAEALVRRGARVDTLSANAGLGRADAVRRLLPDASGDERHRAVALAAQHGRVEVVRQLLDAGEDPNRLNPKGTHAHSTPMHQAALQGHVDIVRILVEHGARVDVKDTIWHATPLGWAVYCKQPAVADYLRSVGAPES
jgi:ankyrin repeat protein